MPQLIDTHERQWFIVSRWQEFKGEGRANLLRLIGIAVFYAVEASSTIMASISASCRCPR